MNFLSKIKKVDPQWISLWFKFRNYKTRWILWTMPENSTILKRQAVLGCVAFPVSLWVFRVLPDWLAAILACSLIHGSHLAYQETFFKIYLHRVSFQQLVLDILKIMVWAPCDPVSLNTGRLAERANELERNPHNFAIPTQRFARRWSTWNPPSHAEWASLQKCMVALPRNQVSVMHFEKFPDTSTFQCWKRVLRPRSVFVRAFLRTLCGSKK